MKANYHTHTWRCHHAAPDERAYIEAARKTGMQVLGFSDHVPYPFDPGYYSDFRMSPEDAPEYVQTLQALRTAYAGTMEIHIGFEAEYYPAYFARLLALLEPLDYEYLILGQHFLDNEQGCPSCRQPTDDPAELEKYVRQCTEALHTGAFSCFAHPDILCFTGDETLYRRAMRRLCREAQACDVPLEINLVGLGNHRTYPRETFWEEASVVGNQVLLGWDAHTPDWMLQPEVEAAGMDMMHRLGLHQIDFLSLRRPDMRRVEQF